MASYTDEEFERIQALVECAVTEEILAEGMEVVATTVIGTIIGCYATPNLSPAKIKEIANFLFKSTTYHGNDALEELIDKAMNNSILIQSALGDIVDIGELLGSVVSLGNSVWQAYGDGELSDAEAINIFGNSLDLVSSVCNFIPYIGDVISYHLTIGQKLLEEGAQTVIKYKSERDSKIASIEVMMGWYEPVDIDWSQIDMESVNFDKLNDYINDLSERITLMSEYISLFQDLLGVDYYNTLLGQLRDEWNYCNTLKNEIESMHKAILASSGDRESLYELLKNSKLDLIGKYFEEYKEGLGDAEKADPLVIDLGANGFSTVNVDNGVYFDMDGNGSSQKTAWISQEEAFLALDKNGNGTIDNGGELFGDQTILKDGTRATSGFEALAEYDLNGDKIINSDDEIFSKLLVWQDKNLDGIATSDELFTLANLGIAGISLNKTTVNKTDSNNATLTNTAGVIYDNGNETTIGEFHFESNLYDTVFLEEVEISKEILELPNVRSLGNMPSLHLAMAKDESGELVALVKSFVQAPDMFERRKLLKDILYHIADVTDIDPNSRGANIDARDLYVMEMVMGETYRNWNTGVNVNNDNYEILGNIISGVYNMYYSLLISQTVLANYLKLINVCEVDGEIRMDFSLFNSYVQAKMNDNVDMNQIIIEMGRYILFLDGSSQSNFSSYYRYFVNICPKVAECIYTTIRIGSDKDDTISVGYQGALIYAESGNDSVYGGNGADALYGEAGNDVLNGGSGADILDGGSGNDSLYGGSGDDTYIWRAGAENDYISDCYGANKIVLEGLSLSDLTWKKSGNYNIVLSIKETGESLTLDYFLYSEAYSNYAFELGDGTILSKDEFYQQFLSIVQGTDANETLYPLSSGTIYGNGGNDVLNGGSGADTLDGGSGNDSLYGGSGNDTYIWRAGEGSDYISDCYGTNKIVLEGLSLSDITWKKSGSYDVVLSIKETGESLTLDYFLYSEAYRNFTFSFADGSEWSFNVSTFAFDNITPVAEDTTVDNQYTFESYNGITTIADEGGNDSISLGVDMLNVIFEQNGDDLTIRTDVNGNGINIEDWYVSENHQIEEFATSDGYALTNKQVQLLIDSMASMTGENGISWSEAIANNDQNAIDIASQIWTKQ